MGNYVKTPTTDGGATVTGTAPDGSQVEIQENADGSKTETITKSDGSVVTKATAIDGKTTETET